MKGDSLHPFDMTKNLSGLLAVSALLALSTIYSSAQSAPPPPPPGPPYHLTTVSWVIATRNNINTDDRYVTLIGHVTGREGGDYLFTDGTGTVRLDAGDFK